MTALSRLKTLPSHYPEIEVWGGVEYTCNRVRDTCLDQMVFSGHAERATDYELFLKLGIRTLRFGLLWERHELDPSWCWEDERLESLQSLGIRPIASLVHHGSGPPHTSLLDPQFPEKLAEYAGNVAERYPWLDAYTPVNEPNTTARFSGLYGLWYPHHLSRASYLRALLNQLKATVLSMKAVRRVRPDAQLIQTDDLGKTTGIDALRPLCELLNLRRWLTFDLLCGRVDFHHPMFAYLRAEGIAEAEIVWFAEHASPPNVIGVNYYLTSDRFLDDRFELYPEDRRSSEGPFVDVEAVRVCPNGIAGIETLLGEAWDRYGIPVAITEVHLGCSVEEQIRWLAESWHGIHRARKSGANCVALTAWALLGSYYWNELVTCKNGHYEPGVFDVRSGLPIPTELAQVLAQVAGGLPPRHPALSRQGWWRYANRILFHGGDKAAA